MNENEWCKFFLTKIFLLTHTISSFDQNKTNVSFVDSEDSQHQHYTNLVNFYSEFSYTMRSHAVAS